MKVKEYADSIDKSRQAVEKVIKAGKIKSYKKNGVRHVNVKSADAFYKTKLKKKSGKKSEPDTYTDVIEPDNINMSKLSKVELALKAEKYKTQKIKNDRDEKKLVSVDELADTVFNFVSKIKEHIQSQHDRISLKIQGSSSQHEIEQILKDDNHRALTGISKNFYDLDDEAVKKKILQRLIR